MRSAPGIAIKGEARLAGRPLLGPLRLTLAGGSWTSLLGASGVGKTTLLRLIADLDTAVTFDGTVAASDGAPLAGRVAYMAQDDLLLPWADILGNVTLGARLRGTRPDRDRAEALIARVGLSAHLRKRPGALSGGQRQRVALARTLMEDRPVVLLDEPFSALDARTRANMQDLAGALLAHRTVLLVTHDPLEVARLSHHAFIVENGGLNPLDMPPGAPVRAIDAPETLKTQAELFGRLRSVSCGRG